MNFGVCAAVLGWGFKNGVCTSVSGCDDQGYMLYDDEAACAEVCGSTMLSILSDD